MFTRDLWTCLTSQSERTGPHPKHSKNDPIFTRKSIQPIYNRTTAYLPILQKYPSHNTLNIRYLQKHQNLALDSMTVPSLWRAARCNCYPADSGNTGCCGSGPVAHTGDESILTSGPVFGECYTRKPLITHGPISGGKTIGMRITGRLNL